MFLSDARVHFYAWHVLPASDPPFCNCLPGQEKTQIAQIPPAVPPAPHSVSDTMKTMKTWICSQSLQRCLGDWTARCHQSRLQQEDRKFLMECFGKNLLFFERFAELEIYTVTHGVAWGLSPGWVPIKFYWWFPFAGHYIQFVWPQFDILATASSTQFERGVPGRHLMLLECIAPRYWVLWCFAACSPWGMLCWGPGCVASLMRKALNQQGATWREHWQRILLLDSSPFILLHLIHLDLPWLILVHLDLSWSIKIAMNMLSQMHLLPLLPP